MAKLDTVIINNHLGIANKVLRGMFPLVTIELLVISKMVLVDNNFLAVAGNSPVVDSRMEVMAIRAAGKERKIVGCSYQMVVSYFLSLRKKSLNTNRERILWDII